MSKKTNRQPKPKAAFALIRAKSPEDVKLLNEIKQITNEKTYSGALMRSASMTKELIANNNNQSNEIKKLKQELKDAKTKLERIIDAQAFLNQISKGVKPRNQEPDWLDDDENDDDYQED